MARKKAEETGTQRVDAPKLAKGQTKATSSILANVRKTVLKVLKEDDPGMVVDPNSLKESRPHLTSGSVVLDYLIGGVPNRHGVPPCPGWPRGAISNIYGHESSGKTTVALEAAAQVCANGGIVCFIDWEHAISLDYAAALGVPVEDPDRFYLAQPNTLEAGIQVLTACADAGVDLIILDSVGAGVPKAIAAQSMEEKGSLGRVGLVAAVWSVVLPQMVAAIAKSGSHIMGLSQLRKNINTTGYGENTTHQGGEAWKYYSSIRVSFRRVQSLKTKDYDALTHKTIERATSSLTMATIKKTKISNSQQREASFHITFGEGIDNTRDLINIGSAHGIVNKAGSWLTFERGDGSIIKSQGIPAFRQEILTQAGAYEELAGKVLAVIRSGGATSVLAVSDEEDDVDDSVGFITEE